MPTATTNVDQPMSTDAHQAALNSDTLPKDGRTADTLDLQRSQPTNRPHRPTTEASATWRSDSKASPVRQAAIFDGHATGAKRRHTSGRACRILRREQVIVRRNACHRALALMRCIAQ